MFEMILHWKLCLLRSWSSQSNWTSASNARCCGKWRQAELHYWGHSVTYSMVQARKKHHQWS